MEAHSISVLTGKPWLFRCQASEWEQEHDQRIHGMTAQVQFRYSVQEIGTQFRESVRASNLKRFKDITSKYYFCMDPCVRYLMALVLVQFKTDCTPSNDHEYTCTRTCSFIRHKHGQKYTKIVPMYYVRVRS